MNRLHKKLFRIVDQLQELAEEERAVRQELDMHRAINDDAQADAAIGNYIDREEAGATRGDVRRFERTLRHLSGQRAGLVDKRNQLLARLPD